jgi:hypothetical protein
MRIGNEERLIAALESRGFTSVPLGRLSVAQQVGLFRGAETIVAAHGADLSPVITAARLSGLVELFPPAAGNDTFAFIAAAGNIRHTAIAGVGDLSVFDVDTEQVCRAADITRGASAGPSWEKPANLLPGSRSLAGFRAAPGCQPPRSAGPQLLWGNRVVEHYAGHAEQHSPTIGGWPDIPVIPGVRYTASCWVWVPEEFTGTEILIALSNEVAAADLPRRGVWQRIATSATPFAAVCSVELRVFSATATAFRSTCWQLERGEAATTYVATP